VSATGAYRAALSVHPVAAVATGEVVGDILEAVGPGPDLAVVVAGGTHASSLEAVVDTVRSTLGPSTLLALSSSGVVGGARGITDQPSLSLWTGWCGPVTPVSIEAVSVGRDVAVRGISDLPDRGTLLLVAGGDFPMGAVLEQLALQRPHVVVAGGLVPSGSRLGVDGWMSPADATTAVGVVLAPDVASVAIAQSHRAVGDPMAITRARGHVIEELAGVPALDRVDAMVRSLGASDRDLLSAGLYLGTVPDEHKVDFDPDDFVVRRILGAVRDTRAVAVSDGVMVGSVVQFHLHDPDMAGSELHRVLNGVSAAGAMVFTCNGRADGLAGGADHDPAIVSDVLGTTAVGGLFCTGEIGPVGPRSWLHAFTATVVAFTAR
jgi:small ligand-binding sensory domain FIST